MNKKKSKKQIGFGILEVVVSIGIITIGMIGVLSLIVQNTQVYYVNKSRYTAVMLAQEGIELVRNIRDSNWRTGADWNSSIVGDGSYRIESNAGTISLLDVDGSPAIDNLDARLKMDSSGIYQHTNGDNTPYYRIIETSTDGCPSADDCLRFIAHVRWRERGNVYNHKTEVYLYDWR